MEPGKMFGGLTDTGELPLLEFAERRPLDVDGSDALGGADVLDGAEHQRALAVLDDLMVQLAQVLNSQRRLPTNNFVVI
jgi:hypothetical protein